MAVAFDAFSNIKQDVQNLNISGTFTPTGTPRGIIVFPTGAIATTQVGPTGCTYGGVAMSLVVSNVLTSSEGGWLRFFFLGSGIPTGTQTVASSGISGNSADDWNMYCISVTATTDTEVVDSDNTINSASQANPSVTLSLASRTCFAALAFASGQGAVSGTSPLANWTSRGETDIGAGVLGCYTFNTIGSSDVTAGWTQTADDAVAIAVAISEVQAAGARRSTLAFLGAG